jgi:hypothetical protein
MEVGPGPFGARREEVVPRLLPAQPWWSTFARCLTATSPQNLSQLDAALERASACGATAFEVIAGAPFARYGARVTFEHSSPEILARAFGLDTHPWGIPRWIGVRAVPGGEIRVKAYHRVERIDERFVIPQGWPRDLYPIMASLHGDRLRR